MKIPDKKTIKTLVHTAVESYVQGFRTRHESEVDNPEGTINMKIHNVVIEALGREIQYYTAFFRIDVLKILKNYYGQSKITEGNKSIKIKASNGRLSADVIVCAQYG